MNVVFVFFGGLDWVYFFVFFMFGVVDEDCNNVLFGDVVVVEKEG